MSFVVNAEAATPRFSSLCGHFLFQPETKEINS